MLDKDSHKLRQHATCLLRHVFAPAPLQDPLRVEIAATLERLDSPRALEQILSTLTGWSSGIVGDALARLDKDLAALGFVTLSQARAHDRQTIPRLLESDRIENRDEYRIASAFSALQGPLGPSPAQRHHLVDLEDRYWEDDREGADTAPMALAWRAAARDLGVQFISPYRLSAEGQPEVWCPGLLPDFGGTKGTVILGRFSSEAAIDLADELGYYSSGLSPLYYERYERELFEETLNDWGLSGDESVVPPWFRGGIGRHGGPEDSDPLP